jgi:predicted nucleotidyltransferase
MKFNISILDTLVSRTKLKIIKFLLTHEASMSEREIASILDVSHMSVNRTVKELSEINFVNFIKVGKAHLWKVNHKSYAYRILSEFIKGVSQIKDPLNDLENTLLKNLPKAMIEKVILFGSIAKGVEKTNSDIDIFFLVKDKEDKEKLKLFLDNLSNTCLEAYGNRLSPYILTEQEMKKKKSLKLISEINKGIRIFPRG